MNKQVRYSCKNLLIKSLSSSCLAMAIFAGSSAILGYSAEAKDVVPDATKRTQSWALLSAIPLVDGFGEPLFTDNVFQAVRNKGWYPNPMMVYNHLAVGQMIMNLYSGSTSLTDTGSGKDYYDSEYSIPTWGEDLRFDVRVVGSMPTENSWDVLQASEGDNSLLGLPLEGNSLGAGLFVDYSLNSDMSLGLSYAFISSKRFGRKTSKGTADLSDTAKAIEPSWWKTVRAEMTQHVVGISGRMEMSDMMMGLRVWGSIAYGFGKSKSQRYVTVYNQDATDAHADTPFLAGHVEGGNFDYVILVADFNNPANISFDNVAGKISKSSIGSSSIYGLLGASFSFPVMDNLMIMPSLEVNYTNYTIESFSERDEEAFPTIASTNVVQFLEWIFSEKHEELKFHQLHVKVKIPFDFKMGMPTGGGVHLGIYPMVNMMVMGEEYVTYSISTFRSDSGTAQDVDVRVGNRAFNPGVGLYAEYVGGEKWSISAGYEVMVMDNDFSHKGKIVFTFSI